jgi:hypothetical protein
MNNGPFATSFSGSRNGFLPHGILPCKHLPREISVREIRWPADDARIHTKTHYFAEIISSVASGKGPGTFFSSGW